MLRAVMISLLLPVAFAAAATPVEKVVGLLEKLHEETQAEGLAESIQYGKFSCFCKAQADQKLENIAKASSSIDRLGAKIKKLASSIDTMDSDVAESKKEIKSLEKKSEEDADTRSADHQDFTIKLNDMNGAINEVTEAIEVMRGGMAATPSRLCRSQQRLRR